MAEGVDRPHQRLSVGDVERGRVQRGAQRGVLARRPSPCGRCRRRRTRARRRPPSRRSSPASGRSRSAKAARRPRPPWTASRSGRDGAGRNPRGAFQLVWIPRGRETETHLSVDSSQEPLHRLWRRSVARRRDTNEHQRRRTHKGCAVGSQAPQIVCFSLRILPFPEPDSGMLWVSIRKSSGPASIAPFLAGLGRPPALPGSSFESGPCRHARYGPDLFLAS